MMDISNITVTEIKDVILVNSRKNNNDKMVCRPSYGISFCKNGRIEYNHKGKTYISIPGNVVILPRYETYEINRLETGEFPVINFHTTEQFTSVFCVIPIQDDKKYFKLFEEMRKIKFERNNHLRMMRIFYHILEELNNESYQAKRPIQKYINYIDMNFGNPELSMNEIASFGNISEVYLRKLFRKYLQISPKQYLINLRISKSKELLESTDFSVEQISQICGYTTVYHFCRSFKSVCNCTPSEYRKMTQAQLI